MITPQYAPYENALVILPGVAINLKDVLCISIDEDNPKRLKILTKTIPQNPIYSLEAISEESCTDYFYSVLSKYYKILGKTSNNTPNEPFEYGYYN